MSTYPKNWNDDVVTDYITQESQEKSPDVFLETHLPITHIRAEILVGGDSTFITERQFLEHILQSGVDTAKNRIYLLKGEVGSGKSHLCQWLEYQINGEGSIDPYDEEHVAIHISRNNTRLADILDKLYEHIDAEHDDFDDVTAYDDDQMENLADTLISMLGMFDGADLNFPEAGFDFGDFISRKSNGLDLQKILTENLRAYKSGVEAEGKEQQFELLNREQFGEICLNTFGRGFGGDDGDTIYPAVRRAIHDRLMVNLGIENFQQDLKDISAQYRKEGKRPVLICEDVTTFNVLKDDLLDHIFQLGDGGEELRDGFDIVLGYTTGWESEKADDALTTGDLSFMTERAQGYLTMTDRNGEAFFLREGSMPVRLVDKYLEVIKEKSTLSTPPDVDDDAFEGMYPFNRRFIARAYRYLQEEGDAQQTPRLLLYHVVGDSLLSNIPPHQRINENPHIADFATPMEVSKLSKEFKQLAKWYGRMDGGQVVVPKAIPETFDVEIPEGIEVVDGLVRLDVMYENVSWGISEGDLEGEDPEDLVNRGRSLTGSTTDVDDGSTTELTGDDPNRESTEETSSDTSGSGTPTIVIDDDNDEEAQQKARRIGQFQNWIGTGGEFPSSNRLSEGVQAALNRFYDPTRLANENSTASGTAAFYYTSGKDVPVTIIGPDNRKRIGVDVHFDGNEQMYLDMFRYGLDGSFPPEANLDRIRGWCDEQVLELRRTMRDDLEGCLPDVDGVPSGFELEELLVLAQVFIHNARTGATTVDRKDVLEVPEHSESSPFRREDSDFSLPKGLIEGFNDLNTRRSQMKELCEGFFLLKSNFVDHDRLAPAIENVTENIDAYTDAAARISADDLESAYKIGTTRSGASTTVANFFTTLSDYANELQKLAIDFDPDSIERDLSDVRELYSFDHTAADLLEFYERLESAFAPLDRSLNAKWEDVGKALQNGGFELNLDAFGAMLRQFEEIEPGNGLEVLAVMHEYTESRRTQDAWKVYKVLGDMIETIDEHEDAEENQFTDELQNRSEFTTFQSNRETAIDALEGI